MASFGAALTLGICIAAVSALATGLWLDIIWGRI
jgi:hypothetical protein